MASGPTPLDPQREGWLAELKTLYRKLRPQYTQAVVEGGFSIIEGKVKLVQANLVAWCDEPLERNGRFDYSSFVLFRARVSLRRFWPIFERFVRTGSLEVPGIGSLSFGGSLERPTLYSAASYPFHSRWPLTVAKISATQDGRLIHEKLSSQGGPLYPGPQDALEEWTGVSPGYSGYGPVVYCAFPDFRAHITSVVIGGRRTRVLAENGPAGSGKLLIKYYASAEGQTPVHGSVDIRRGAASCDVGYTPSRFLADLYGESESAPLDSRDFNATYLSRQSDVKFSLPGEDLKNLISGGESTFVEFKTVLPSKELTETVCAFANTSGGTIFVGVAEDTRVIGFKSDRYGKTYIDAVIRDALDPIPPYRVRFVKIGRKPLTVIEVPEGTAKPYTLRNRGVYIRANSSDRTANPRETVELCSSATGNK